MSGHEDSAANERFRAHLAWLQSSTPFEWHRVALDFNWDEDLRPLVWILRQRNCDRATVKAIFWKSVPTAFLGSADIRDGRYHPGGSVDLLAGPLYDPERVTGEAVSGMLENRYRRSRILWKPDGAVMAEHREYAAMEAERGIARPLAGCLASSSIGLVVENDHAFYERYPDAFHGTYLLPLDDTPEAMAGVPLGTRIGAALHNTTRKASAWIEGIRQDGR